MPKTPPGTTTPFLPAHLGELTSIITPDLVDDALATTRKTQHRIRLLPSRTVVYFLLAMTLFPHYGYTGVWTQLVANLGVTTNPSAAALRHARRRIGTPPLRALLRRLLGTATTDTTLGAQFHGLTVAAIDGTTMAVPDTTTNATAFGRGAGSNGTGGYPLVRLGVIIACGTRAIIDVICGPLAEGELAHAQRLLRCLTTTTLLLADRNYDSYDLLRDIAATGAQLLVRAKTQRILPVLAMLSDQSYLSFIPAPGTPAARFRAWRRAGMHGPPPQVPGREVRVVVATVTVTDDTGRVARSTIRLITTLTDHHRYPAGDIAALYHERWEIETAFYGIKTIMRGADRVLRSGTPGGVEQEIHAYLITYQATRIRLCAAADDAGLDPDRLSFTVALRTARQKVITAHNPDCTCTCTPRPSIAEQLLDPRNLLPAQRRSRTSARTVKQPLSAYAYKDKTDRHKHNVTTTVTVKTANHLTAAANP
jgi:hypothetical protein